MLEVLDPGHKYKLLTLDGNWDQTLTFVKRMDLDNPERFPGNTSAYCGTTMQSVFRCLADRIKYLNDQIPDMANVHVMRHICESLWHLEERAARRHGYTFPYGIDQMLDLPMCPHCGHVVCEKLGNAVKA